MFDKIDDLFSDLKSEVSGLMQENCGLKRKLEKLQEEKEQTENNKKWMPDVHEKYFFINSSSDICSEDWYNIMEDNFRLSIGNCFQTEEEANQYLEHLKTKAELKALADELNGDEIIDWSDSSQQKFYLYKSYDVDVVGISYDYTLQTQGIIYCLDTNFLDKAIERIGEQRLIDMIKAGV